MVKALEITGQRFGRLVAIRRDGVDAHGKVQWLFACDCGNETVATASLAKRGTTQSCGCLHKESAARNGLEGGKKPRHGAASKGDEHYAEYCIWKSMRQRCSNKNTADYPAYGGRGIKVCSRWNLFENFLADMGARPSSLYSIDRIDPNGDYEPNNCRWADDFEQARNRRKRGTGEYLSIKQQREQASHGL